METRGSIEAKPWRVLARRVITGVGLAALMPLLYSGDKAATDQDVWTGAHPVSQEIQGIRSIPRNLSFGTFNMHYGYGDWEGVLNTVERMNVDILGATEAGPRLAANLARINGYHIAQSEVSGRPLGGNVLLSRYPIKQSFTFLLPTRPDLEQRTALFAEVEMEGRTQWVGVTHLTQSAWGDPENEIREAQVRALLSVADTLEPRPVWLGDLNFTSDSDMFRLVDETYDSALTEVGLGYLPTFDGFLRARGLDFVLVPEGDDFPYQQVGGGLIDSHHSSDHDAIAATYVPTS